MRRKIISFVLVFVMVFSTFSLTSCSSKKKSDRWEISDEDVDNIESLDITANQSGNEISLDIESSDITFKDKISKNDIRIMAALINEQDEYSDEETSAENESSDKNNADDSEMNEIESFDVEWQSESKITVTFNEVDENANVYYVYIHKDAVNEAKYASGCIGVNNIEEESYDIELTDKISMYEKNPSIDIKNNVAFKINEDIVADDVSVSGSFSEMTVESVDVDESNAVIKLNGKPSVSGQGIIVIPADKTDCGILTIKVNVIDTMLSIDNSSLKYENGTLTFDVKKYDGKFTENDNSRFTLNDKELTIESYSDEGDIVTLSLKSEAKNIDDAVAELKDQVIVSNSDSMENGIEGRASFNIPDVSIQAAVKSYANYSDYIDFTINVYSEEGTFNELNNDSFEFSGDFENSEIQSVTRMSDNLYKLEIRTDLKSGIADINHLTGSVKLKDNSVVCNWKTSVTDLVSAIDFKISNSGGILDISFGNVVKKAKEVLSVASILGFPSGPFKEILDVCGDYAGKADSVSSFAKKCLLFAGIIEEDEDDAPDIYKEVSDLKKSISELKGQIASIESMIQENDNERHQSEDYIHYADYRAAWKSFYNGELKNMQEIMDSFKSYYDEYIITFMKNSGKSGTATGNINNGIINIFLNKDGKVEVPSTENEAYSLYYSETELTKYVFSPEHFKDACVEYEKDNSKDVISLILEDSSFDSSLAKFNSDNGTEIDKDDIRNAIETQAASYAIVKIGATNIIKAYNDYTDAILSDDIMYGNIMETYIKMISYCYNFQSEAQYDISEMQNYLQMFTISSSAFASYVSWFSPSYKRSENPIEKQYTKSMEILEKNYLHDVSLEVKYGNKKYCIEDYYDWSYILNDKIHATLISGGWDKIPASASASNSESAIVTQKEMQLIYNRYKDMCNRNKIAVDNFYDYLVDRNIIVSSREEEFKDKYVALRYEVEDSIDPEASYQATNVSGKYFTWGEHYVVGTGNFGNNNKASQKYISNKRTVYRVGYKLNDVLKPEVKTRRSSSLFYYESHWYWPASLTTNEAATLYKKYDMDEIIFTKGDVSEWMYYFYDKVEYYKDDYTWIELDN